jgi:hypothetical protein
MQYALEQLENVVDFVITIEPLIKSSVPQLINYLDDLEQRGVLRIIQSTLDVRAKIAATHSPEDVEQIGDSLVALLGMAQKLSDPQSQAFLKKIAALPSKVGRVSCTIYQLEYGTLLISQKCLQGVAGVFPFTNISDIKSLERMGSDPIFAGERIWKNRWFNVRMGAAGRRVSMAFPKKKAASGFGRPVFG